MGRRSDFTRRAADFYQTPLEQAQYILSQLASGPRFIEPCAGDGRLVRWLKDAGHVCVRALDTEPRGPGIEEADGPRIGVGPEPAITNPPWSRHLLLPLLDAWMTADRNCWLLLPRNLILNGYWGPYSTHTAMIVPAGRSQWIEDTPHRAKDNAVWVQLTREKQRFLLPRQPKPRRTISA